VAGGDGGDDSAELMSRRSAGDRSDAAAVWRCRTTRDGDMLEVLLLGPSTHPAPPPPPAGPE